MRGSARPRAQGSGESFVDDDRHRERLEFRILLSDEIIELNVVELSDSAAKEQVVQASKPSPKKGILRSIVLRFTPRRIAARRCERFDERSFATSR
jgi:hypothetical protein